MFDNRSYCRSSPFKSENSQNASPSTEKYQERNYDQVDIRQVVVKNSTVKPQIKSQIDPFQKKQGIYSLQSYQKSPPKQSIQPMMNSNILNIGAGNQNKNVRHSEISKIDAWPSGGKASSRREDTFFFTTNEDEIHQSPVYGQNNDDSLDEISNENLKFFNSPQENYVQPERDSNISQGEYSYDYDYQGTQDKDLNLENGGKPMIIFF
jgi:hypothetical protein